MELTEDNENKVRKITFYSFGSCVRLMRNNEGACNLPTPPQTNKLPLHYDVELTFCHVPAWRRCCSTVIPYSYIRQSAAVT
jgi:hypothetical protein